MPRSSLPAARPEDGAATAAAHYNEGEAIRYTLCDEVVQKQLQLSARALQLLFEAAFLVTAPGKAPALLGELGCGSGLSARLIDSLGLTWVGIDVSSDMLALAASAPGQRSGLLQADLGQGLPLRSCCLDGAISVSAVQWLLPRNADTEGCKCVSTFLTALFACLRPGAPAVAQLYLRHAQDAQVCQVSHVPGIPYCPALWLACAWTCTCENVIGGICICCDAYR